MSWEGGDDIGKAEGRGEERSMRESKEAEASYAQVLCSWLYLNEHGVRSVPPKSWALVSMHKAKA